MSLSSQQSDGMSDAGGQSNATSSKATSDASVLELSRQSLPSSYLAAHILREDEGIFRDGAEKDVRRSLHVGEVPMPQLAPDEVLIAVMASAINYNTVWSAMFEPIPTFRFLERLGRQGGWDARHDLPITSSDQTRLGWWSRSARRCAVGQSAIASSSTRARSITRIPRRRSTACSPPISALGDLRRTSADSPTTRS